MKRILSIATFLICTLTISAGPISRDQAQSIAKSFLQQRGIEMAAPKEAFKAAKTGTAVSDEAYYYIFNAGNNHGFVVVSGNDATEPILGYTDSGDFDEATMPDNMRSWLQHYADEMKYIESNRVLDPNADTDAIVAKAMKKTSPARHSVAPLLTCTWNQGSPYNDKCPMYYNEDGTTGEHAATGCVATALAQVLYFYKYPAKTKARIGAMSNTYNTPDGTKTVSLTGIKTGTEIDWANMVDNYTGNETQEQKDAVATLMLMCGQAVQMGYGASSGAAFGSNVAEMYHKIFGYDDKAYAADRNDYSITDWFNLLYNELATGHPIPMAGYSSGGGHSFVIDGFDGNELFHLNWGWGGLDNGYFLISVMNPDDSSGIGSSSSSDGYSMGECVIIGLDMPDEETTESRTCMSVTDITVNGTKIKANYINWTGASGTFNYTIGVQDENGDVVPVNEADIQTTTLSANYYNTWEYDLQGKLTTPGTYKVSPASKLSKNSIWRPEYNMGNEYLEVIVGEDGNITSITKHPTENLEVASWDVVTNQVSGTEQEVKVTFKNNGDEYFKEVHLFASNTDTKEGTDCRCAVAVKAGETATFSFYFTPSATGTWNLWLCTGSDGSGEIGSTQVSIGSIAKNQAKLEVSSVSVTNNAYGNVLSGNMTVKNNATTAFAGYVKMTIWSNADGDAYWWGGNSTRLYYDIPAGGSATASFNFEGLEIGKNYRFAQSYTTQDGDLTNGGIWDGSSWTLKNGYLYWGSTGIIGGAAVGSSVTVSNSTSGALFNGVTAETINPGTNSNTIYAFQNATVPSTLEGSNVVDNGTAESINIISTKPVYCPVDFTAKKATFSHTFSVAGDGEKGWEAITLPFKPTKITIDGNEVTWKHGEDDGQFWLREFSLLSDDNEVIFSDVWSMAELRGNTPYVIAVPEEYIGKTIVFEADNASFKNTGNDPMLIGSDAFKFYGITVNKRMGDIFVLNDAGDAYEYTETNKTVKAFTNYFVWKLDTESRPASIKITNTALGIKDVNSNLSSESKLYDLQGREVSTPTHGIYIKNGKKIIIK